MAKSTYATRRGVMKWFAAGGIAAAAQGPVAVIAAPGPLVKTPIGMKLEEWLALWSESHDPLLSDEGHTSKVKMLCAVQNEIRHMACETAQDWIAKVIVLTSFGSFLLEDVARDPDFWNEGIVMILSDQEV